jgi:hypothetical protein
MVFYYQGKNLFRHMQQPNDSVGDSVSCHVSAFSFMHAYISDDLS